MANKKNCENCGGEITDKRGGAKFCCDKCKNEYNYGRRKGDLKISPKKPEIPNPLEASLKGVIKSETVPQDQDKETDKRPKQNTDTFLFNDLLNQKMLSNGTETEQNDNRQDIDNSIEKEEVLNNAPYIDTANSSNKHITQEIKVENPFYKRHKRYLKTYEQQKQNLDKEYCKLEEDLKFQESRNGNTLPLAGGLGAGLFALMTESKQEKADTLEQILKIAFYGALGTGAGYVAKASTDDWRENDKAKKIKTIKGRMYALNQDRQQIIKLIESTKSTLSISSPYINLTKKISQQEHESKLSGLLSKDSKNDLKSTELIKFKSDKILKATDIQNLEYKAIKFEGLWKEFFHLPSINFKALIHGNSGEGKSTFCMWFARYLAENFGRVLYVSAEEGINKTFQDKLKFCKAGVNDFYVLDVRTGDEFMREVGVNEFHFIILDSLHDMDIDARKLKEIFEKYKNTAFIAIDQNNKKGELLGANEKKHLQDIVVNVKDYVAETTKNRFKQKGMSFNTADFIKSVK